MLTPTSKYKVQEVAENICLHSMEADEQKAKKNLSFEHFISTQKINIDSGSLRRLCYVTRRFTSVGHVAVEQQTFDQSVD